MAAPTGCSYEVRWWEEQLYKTMYLKMMNACEEAMELLIRAQRECEELYLSQEDFPSQEIKKGAT